MAIRIERSDIPDSWNEWSKILHSFENDLDTEKNKPDDILGKIFNVEKSDRFGEKHSSMTSTGDFAYTAEGADAPLDEYGEGFSKLVQHEQYMKKLVITAAMREDANIKAVKDLARQFIMGYKRSRVKMATAALCCEGTTYDWGGHTHDRTTGDGKALFAQDHPGKKGGVGTQSNVFTNEFSLDMLVRLGNIGRNFKNQSGEVMGYDFDTIIIPGNAPALEEQIKRTIRSDLVVGSANNDINTQKGLWQLVVNPYWIVEDATAPYIIMSSEANKELSGNMFFDRIPLTIIERENVDNHNFEQSGRFRASVGFFDWRHVMMGGASVGTALV